MKKSVFYFVLFLSICFALPNYVSANIKEYRTYATSAIKTYLCQITGFCEETQQVDCTKVENCAFEQCLQGDHLTINEIQPHPLGVLDSTGEYVEFANFSQQCVWLNGWYFEEESGSRTYFPNDAVVPAQGLYLVAGEFTQSPVCPFRVNAIFGYNFGLNDNQDMIILYNSQSQEVSRAIYENHGCDDGQALEYCGDGVWQCSENIYGNDYCYSTGTPNAENQCLP